MILESPGYYGKLPARGDFIGRRVPPALAAAWDGWLGMLTTVVRAGAGADWPEAWLTAPLWRFALGAGIAAPETSVGAAGAAGVLVASVDRVGRMFPFTVIGPCAGIPAPGWLDAVERQVLDALDDGFDPETLDDALQRIGPADTQESLAPGQSWWSCQGSDRVAPTTILVTGLPGQELAAAMVLGDQKAPHSGLT